MTYYDDIGEAYEWAVKLPVAAISLDFLGVPGSALGNETAALIEKHGFPADKRLGAGVVDGRSVFADGDSPSLLVAALLAKVWLMPTPSHPSCACHLVCWITTAEATKVSNSLSLQVFKQDCVQGSYIV